MIEARAWEDLAGFAVFRDLDAHDLLEAEAVRGQPCTSLSLWADWRAVRGAHLACHVFTAHGEPFAVGALAHTGQAGVAEGALLARDHARFRGPLARLAVLIRNELPGYCAARGIRRIEARSWARHPTGGRLLAALGFRCEATLPGFGGHGRETFEQFAFLPPPPPPQQQET
jgi:hypothetical protein